MNHVSGWYVPHPPAEFGFMLRGYVHCAMSITGAPFALDDCAAKISSLRVCEPGRKALR
jgi:hypothetical protein